MSGPKCAQWDVERNLERERRIEIAIRERIGYLQNEKRNVLLEWKKGSEKFGSDFPELPNVFQCSISAASDIEQLRLTEKELEEFIFAARSTIAEANSTLRIREMIARIAQSSHDVPTLDPIQSARSLGGTESNDLAAREAAARKILSQMASSVPSAERKQVEQAFQDTLLEINTNRFRDYLLDLQRTVQLVNGAQKKRERIMGITSKLMRNLAGLESEEIIGLRREIGAMQIGEKEFRESIPYEVDQAVAKWTAIEDRNYAAHVILQELGNLGYSTTDTMETTFVEGGELIIENSTLKDYKVLITPNKGSREFDVSLVRERSSKTSEGKERQLVDRNMEEIWCADFAAAVYAASAKGVVGRVTKHTKPGTVPVKVLDPSESAAKKRRRAPLHTLFNN